MQEDARLWRGHRTCALRCPRTQGSVGCRKELVFIPRESEAVAVPGSSRGMMGPH